jgi:hypothetical protein
MMPERKIQEACGQRLNPGVVETSKSPAIRGRLIEEDFHGLIFAVAVL